MKEHRSSAGSVAAIVIGSLVGLLSLALVAGGGGVLWAKHAKQDSAGYFTTHDHRLGASTYALTKDKLDVGNFRWIGTHPSIRIRATSGRPVFIGIAHTDDVARYLNGVAHTKTQDLEYDPFKVQYQTVAGTRTPAAPAAQHFWSTSATGTRNVAVAWPIEKGHWTVVVMNADGSRGVHANIDVGAKVTHLGLITGGLFGGGALLLGISALLVLLGVRGLGGGGGAAPAPAAHVASVYPVRVEGTLAEPLSRWLWLVKWILAIPHFIVLAFLWVAAAVLTVVAWFAILVTGRYPRAIFDFNVGVLRWTWRVGYYATDAIGTDRYPPFTLGEAPDYPATLSVEYPEQLSRPLTLVKWILAIPHLIVVGILSGGIWFGWTASNADWASMTGGGLIGLLVVVAGVVLLFSGRYPRGLWELLLGLNRWVLRVTAYVLLMTDEYPPFRLDQGGSEPPPAPAGAAVIAGA
jgi:hypothetical protein